MRMWLRDLWHVVLLRTAVFDGLRRRPDAFLQGFIVIVVIALLAGLPGLVLDLVHGVQATRSAREVAEAQAEVRQGIERFLRTLDAAGVPRAEQAQVRDRFEAGIAFAAEVAVATAELPTALPRPTGDILRTIGGWLSRPLADGRLPLATAAVGTWLGYGVWVMLSARLLGGRGTLHGFFGATAVYAVPHILDIFARVPVAGPALGFVATVWGLAVYVKATAVSHELTFERALLAFLLPALLVGVAIFLLIMGLVIMSLIVALV